MTTRHRRASSTLISSCVAALAISFVSTHVGAQSFNDQGSVGDQSSTNAAARGAQKVPANKVGRSATLPELQRLHGQRGSSNVIREGAINPLRVPRQLSPRPAFNFSGDNAGVSEIQRSNAPSQSAPPVDISAEGFSTEDNIPIVGGLVTPPDTNGDVGQDHYVQYVNVGWVVLNKDDGSLAAGPFAGNLFWQGFGGVCEVDNAGDPIVLYDHLAGRWVFSQFTSSQNVDGHQCVAISDGEDPLGPYTLFDFTVSPGAFNDYPKITVWPDGYYMTTHEFGPDSFLGVNLTVFDRDAMLAGAADSSFIQFTQSNSGDDLEFGSQVGHLEGNDLPPAGSCNTVVHAADAQAFGLPGEDRFRFWRACVDFDNPANSSLDQVGSINVPNFDQNFCNFQRNCLTQNSASDNRLDALAGFTMYRFSQRYFPEEGVLKSAVTVNVDVGNDRAGVMWAGFDVNPQTSAASIGDDGNLLGVIDFDDNLNRWMGSAAVDAQGNIGIGYTVAGTGVFPSIRYTVHERGIDQAGQVQAEASCIEGTGSTEGANRWADYTSTSVDPENQCTFWHTSEYVETTGNRQWNTRVCSFTVPSCLDVEPDFPINLDAERRGRNRVRLSWDGANGRRVDIFRDGRLRARTRNDGRFTDRIGRGTFTYQVCERNSEVCSNFSVVSR